MNAWAVHTARRAITSPPNLVLPDTDAYPLGKYGRMRRRYLKEHHPALYNTMTLNGTLHQHLAEIDQTCHARMERICTAMAAQEGVSEALKASVGVPHERHP